MTDWSPRLTWNFWLFGGSVVCLPDSATATQLCRHFHQYAHCVCRCPDVCRLFRTSPAACWCVFSSNLCSETCYELPSVVTFAFIQILFIKILSGGTCLKCINGTTPLVGCRNKDHKWTNKRIRSYGSHNSLIVFFFSFAPVFALQSRLIVAGLPELFQQCIDTSSRWSQLWEPQPACWQLTISVSDPLQFTLSSQIGPVPYLLPYLLPKTWLYTENLTNTQINKINVQRTWSLPNAISNALQDIGIQIFCTTTLTFHRLVTLRPQPTRRTSWKLVANRGWQPGFPQLVRLVGCGLYRSRDNFTCHFL